MINIDSDQNEDSQIVNVNFCINSGSNDETAFFHMPPPTFVSNMNNEANSSNIPFFFLVHLTLLFQQIKETNLLHETLDHKIQQKAPQQIHNVMGIAEYVFGAFYATKHLQNFLHLEGVFLN